MSAGILTDFEKEQKQNPPQVKRLDNLPACFTFTPACKSFLSSPQPPLVLLFAWMLAKDKYLEKYRQFWTTRGYDVLTVQTGPLDTLLPSVFASRNARLLIDFLRTKEHHDGSITPRYSRVIFHNLSVGNYIAQEVLYQLKLAVNRGEHSAATVHSSISGIIMDSITFLEDSAAGIAQSLTNNWPLQWVIRTLIGAYYALTAPFTWNHYQKVIPLFVENPARLPTLVLYSLDDPLSDWRRIKATIEDWKGRGITVHERCWPQSQHVLHYKLHPQEYTEAVEEFLINGVGDSKNGDKLGDNAANGEIIPEKEVVEN